MGGGACSPILADLNGGLGTTCRPTSAVAKAVQIVLGEMLSTRSIHRAFFLPTPTHARALADTTADLIYKRDGQDFVLVVGTATTGNRQRSS